MLSDGSPDNRDKMSVGHGASHDNRYITQPRIDLQRDLTARKAPVGKLWNVFRREECHDGSDYNTCEKPINTNITNLAIILGVVIPVVVAVFVLIYLHRRNVKKLRQEDAQDPTKDLDFGLDDAPSKGGKRKSLFGLGGEKHHKGNQLSMDMNLSSPYLLPPTMHQSHDSVHSLARTFHNDQDPYRTVGQYANSDAGSIRSFNPKNPSLYGNKRESLIQPPAYGTSRSPPSRFDSVSNQSVSPTLKSAPPVAPAVPEPLHHQPLSEEKKEPARPAQLAAGQNGLSYPDEKEFGLEMPDVQSPPPALSRDSHYGPPSPPFEHDKPMVPEPQTQPQLVYDHSGAAHSEVDGFNFPKPGETKSPGPGLDFELPKINTPNDMEESAHGQSMSHNDYGHSYPEETHYYERDQDDGYGYAHLDHEQNQNGLGVPQQQLKRMSVGFRPLPPDEVMESEDPEYRANRIRSFYKEYFDDKEAPPAMPAVAEYYEDYDAGYLGDNAYYDADSNAFVMPYAQPVTRRAMTPPPAGRFRGGPGYHGGPRGPPRGPHGSIGGMSLPGGPRRPRAGSAFGGSAYSSRPGSSASGMRGRASHKNLPPPSDLHTLPTPSKLKDDNFALFNATDFAPPDSFREQASGRSQSPLGERRAYQPKVPVASPLVHAFDELSALPSPHLLRKSATFTNLDFAPPKKFKDADTMSDAGSIRSNKSGISAVQLHAIRGGAGRISRLPGDTVFTSAALENQLKPQWGMRT